MKLLIVSQYFYPEQFRVNDICFHLAEHGHEITVLTGLPNYPMGTIFPGYDDYDIIQEEHIKGVRVLRCPLRPRMQGNKNLALNYISFAYQGRKISKFLVNQVRLNNTVDFDRILVFQYSPVTMALPAIYLKRKLKKPLSIYCFDLWPESIVSAGLSSKGPVYWLVKHLSRWIYQQCDQLIISSKGFSTYFKCKLQIQKSIHYLPIYAEDLFKVVPKVESDGKVHLLFAGNIGKMQSVDTILRAANELRTSANIHFDIVGDGTALEECKALAKALCLPNVTFHGRHPLDAMPFFYGLADAFLVTLKKDPFISYTLPGKFQSYLAAGKPILAAADGEILDIIAESQCGMGCSSEDSQALAKMIETFIQQRELHNAYGSNGKKYYEQYFSKKAFFKVFLELMNDWK